MKMPSGSSIQNSLSDAISAFIRWGKENKLLILCLVIYLFTAVFFSSQYLANWDAGQFALGTERYSLSDHQPHPPGYFLFIVAGEAFDLLFDDINRSFVWINITAGLIAVIFLHKLLFALSQNKWISFWITVLFIANPVFWFYHSVALTYTFEALTAVLLTYFTYQQIQERGSGLPISAFSVGLIAGFRPSIVIIALPFLFAQFWCSRQKLKDIGWALSAGLAGILLWLPFFIQKVGGIGTLYDLIVTQFEVAKDTAVYNINQTKFLFLSLLYAVHLPFVLIALHPKQVWRFLREQKLMFIPIVIVWQIIVYLILHFGEVGYIVGLIPLFYIPLASFGMGGTGRRSPARTPQATCASFLIILILLEAAIFFFGMPFIQHHKLQQLTHADIQRHDRRVAHYLDAVRNFNPTETLVIVSRGQYTGPEGEVRSYPYDDARLLSYYLPEYRLIDLLGTTDRYYVARNYEYQRKNTNEVFVSREVKQVVILADYIHPDTRPSEFEVEAMFEEPSVKNVYRGEFNGNMFEYRGVFFSKF